MKKFFVSFALLMAFAITSFAQTANAPVEKRKRGEGQPNMEKRGEKLKTDLGLTDDQFRKVKELGEATKGKLKGVRADNAMAKDQKRAQLKQINDEHEAGMKGILTADQFSKWQTIRKEERQKMKDMRGQLKDGQPNEDGNN